MPESSKSRSQASSLKPQDSPGEWYAGGLRFSCTQCGNCCTGAPGTVWFTDAEAAAIAGSLRIEITEFYENYANKVDGRWSL